MVVSHVLVVEPRSDPETERALRHPQFDVRFAHDARQALESVTASMPAVIVLDMLVPDLDAWELLSKIREKLAGCSALSIPIVILLTDRRGAWQAADFGSVRLSDRQHLRETFEEALGSLGASRPDLADAAVWEAALEAVRAKGNARQQGETERMRRLGIIDEHDRAQRQDWPADMTPGSRTDTAT